VVEALDSIARQSLLPSRLVVVDDGSEDDTGRCLQEWQARVSCDLDVRLICQSNAGPAVARNRGVAQAGACELLAFLDSDDLWPVDYLERMGDALRRQPEAVAATCDRINLNCRSGAERLLSRRELSGSASTPLFQSGSPGLPNTVLRTSTFHQLGGFATLPCLEDYQLMLRLSLRGSWLYVPGQPVITRRYLYTVAGGEPPLSKKYAERALFSAQVRDRFIHEDGGARVVPEEIWRPRLTRSWNRASRHLAVLGRHAEARQCLAAALQLCPWHLGARWNQLRQKVGF
jgi:glycosyltransferase involved in cell wall biosynthesis